MMAMVNVEAVEVWGFGAGPLGLVGFGDFK